MVSVSSSVSAVESTLLMRTELMSVIQYITHNSFIYNNSSTSSISQYRSIINESNRLGNTALHYCFNYRNNSNLLTKSSIEHGTTNNTDVLLGATVGEYILSLRDTVITYQSVDVLITVDDLLKNNDGLTCYEGLQLSDLEHFN